MEAKGVCSHSADLTFPFFDMQCVSLEIRRGGTDGKSHLHSSDTVAPLPGRSHTGGFSSFVYLPLPKGLQYFLSQSQ